MFVSSSVEELLVDFENVRLYGYGSNAPVVWVACVLLRQDEKPRGSNVGWDGSSSIPVVEELA